MQPCLAAMIIDQGEGPRLVLEKPHKLRGCAAKRGRGPLGIMAGACQNIQGLGQKSGKIVVFGVHYDPTALAPAVPQFAGPVRFWPSSAGRHSHMDGQLEPEPEQSFAAILALGSPFGGLGTDAREAMSQDDRRLHLVSVLASGARATGRPEVALGGKRVEIDRGGMNPGRLVLWPLHCDRVRPAHGVQHQENGKTQQSVPAVFQNRIRPLGDSSRLSKRRR